MITLRTKFRFKLLMLISVLSAQVSLYPRTTRTIGRIDSALAKQQTKPDVREVHFTNDIPDLIDLDLECQYGTTEERTRKWGEREEKCLAHFREIPVTIRAEKLYTVKGGDEIKVQTKNSWELSIQQISNEALLSLKTFRDLVIDQFMPKKRIANFMDDWVWTPYNRAKLYVYQKVIARFATTTIVIHTDIEPHYESIRCSDIILDLDKLANENKLNIEIAHENLLNMHVVIKPVKYTALPGTFF